MIALLGGINQAKEIGEVRVYAVMLYSCAATAVRVVLVSHPSAALILFSTKYRMKYFFHQTCIVNVLSNYQQASELLFYKPTSCFFHKLHF